MPRSLVSFWKRVATSGPTVDGRVILPQELRDIAETYSTSTYTASIWSEHERWPGAHGTVFAVRLVEDEEGFQPGQVALEAQLKPNQRLLYLNDQGEKLFTSIEITPDFANTGKAYLTGLAVTDSPASLGTQELYFSRKTGQPAHFAAYVPLGQLELKEEEPTSEIGKLTRLLTRMFSRFAVEPPTDTTPSPPTESKTPMDEATATALAALLEQLLIVAAGIKAVIDPAVEEAPAPDQAPIDDVSTAVNDIVTTAEEEREFRRNAGGNKAVLAALSKLERQFNALQNTPAGRQVPKVAGPAVATRKRVY